MIEATRTSTWRLRYDIVGDGQLIATYEGRALGGGGTLHVNGCPHELTPNFRHTRYKLADEAGITVATADDVGRMQWTVQTNEQTHYFERASFWRSEQVHVVGGSTVGFVRKKSAWTGGAIADLPGLPTLLQAFVTTVVVCMWDAQAASAAAGGAAATGATG